METSDTIIDQTTVEPTPVEPVEPTPIETNNFSNEDKSIFVAAYNKIALEKLVNHIETDTNSIIQCNVTLMPSYGAYYTLTFPYASNTLTRLPMLNPNSSDMDKTIFISMYNKTNLSALLRTVKQKDQEVWPYHTPTFVNMCDLTVCTMYNVYNTIKFGTYAITDKNAVKSLEERVLEVSKMAQQAHC